MASTFCVDISQFYKEKPIKGKADKNFSIDRGLCELSYNAATLTCVYLIQCALVKVFLFVIWTARHGLVPQNMFQSRF